MIRVKICQVKAQITNEENTMKFYSSTLHMICSIFCLISFISEPLWGQEAETREEDEKKKTRIYLMDKVVVTAKLYESKVFNTSLPINIIDQEDIERIQPLTTADLFKNQPGIDVSQTGMGTERPMIRGLYDSRVLILVDGIKLSEQRPGGDHAFSIDPSQIERVEVVRGPASVLYGSEAIGGVINFITKKQRKIVNDGMRFNGSVEAGYDSAINGRLAGLSLDGGYNRFNYYFGGMMKKTDDVKTPEGKLYNSAVEDYNYSGGFNYSWDKMSLSLSGFGSRADIEVPTFENNYTKARFENEQHHAVFLNFESKKMSDEWISLKIDSAFQRHNRRMRIINPANQPVKVDVDFDTCNFNPQTTFKIGSSHTVITGIQTLFESEKSDRVHPSPLINGVGVIPPSTRLGIGAFAQDEIAFTDRFIVTVGLRYDWFRSENNGEDGHPVEAVIENDSSVSGSLGLLYGIVKNRVNLTANAGRAFRAPTLHERFFYGPHQGTADYGNPELDPETAWNFDAGVKVNNERLWFALSAFYNRIDDYIEKRLTGGTEFGLPKAEYANVSEAELYGGEIETELKTGLGLSFFGNLSYVRGKNLTSHENLSSIPPLKGAYGLRYEYMAGKMNMWSELSFHSASEQIDPGPNENKTHGYTTMDIRAGAKIDRRLSVTLYCKNITDEAYHDHLSRINPTNAPEVDGLEQPGRSFGGSVKLYF